MDEFARRSARDIMREHPVCVPPSLPLAELEQILLDHHISGVPVVERGRLIGVVSRSDLLRVRALMKSLDGAISDSIHAPDGQSDGDAGEYHGFTQRLDRLTVRDAMRRQVVRCHPETPIAELAADMVRQHVHRMIVVENDAVVGIISSLDLVALVADTATTSVC